MMSPNNTISPSGFDPGTSDIVSNRSTNWDESINAVSRGDHEPIAVPIAFGREAHPLQLIRAGPSWLWLYGSWTYNNYLFKSCSCRGVLHTTLCDKFCQWLAKVRWFSLGTLVSSTYKTDCLDIAEMLLKVALNTITHYPQFIRFFNCSDGVVF